MQIFAKSCSNLKYPIWVKEKNRKKLKYTGQCHPRMGRVKFQQGITFLGIKEERSFYNTP